MSNQTERFKLVVAVCIIMRRDNNVLLLKRANTGYHDGDYGLIGGHLNGKELATQAVIREAKEEVGVNVNKDDLQLAHTLHKLDTGTSSERIELVFETTKWDSEAYNAETDLCDGIKWFPINKLPANIIPRVKALLNDVTNGVRYSEFIE